MRLSITEVRKRLLSLPEQLAKSPEQQAVTITRHGKPVLALMPWELYEAISETMELMSEPELMNALRQSIRDVKAGRTYTSAQVAKRLGL